MKAKLPTEYFDPLGIGGETVFTYVLIHTFGTLIGQDIRQRVFTARSDTTARWGGTVAGTYCLVYAVAGAVIGTAAKVMDPQLPSADAAFAAVVKDELPVGVRGLVLAAALAASAGARGAGAGALGGGGEYDGVNDSPGAAPGPASPGPGGAGSVFGRGPSVAGRAVPRAPDGALRSPGASP